MDVAGRQQQSMTTALEEGRSIEIRGRRLSGRTTLLDRLGELSTSRRIPHRRVEGSEPLRDHPFGALLISGLLESATLAGPNPLRAAVEAVRRRLPSSGPAALLVDDADHLDAQSVAVLRHLERRGLVVAAAYRTDLAGRAAPRVVSGAPVVVDAPSLAPSSLLSTLRERLGGAVSARLLSEVFALSGGVVGVAEHLVDDGVFDGSITQVDGAWDLRGPLVSRSLDGLWQAFLRELPPADCHWLTTLATAGRSTLGTLPPAALDAVDRLESLGHVRTVRRGDGRAVLVSALLAEHVRRTSDAVARSASPPMWVPPVEVDGPAPGCVVGPVPRELGWRAQLVRQAAAPDPHDLSTQLVSGGIAEAPTLARVLGLAERSTRLTSDPSVLTSALEHLARLDDGSDDVRLALAAATTVLEVVAGVARRHEPPADDPRAHALARAKACEARLYDALAAGRFTATDDDLALASTLADESADVVRLVPRLRGLQSLVTAFRGDLRTTRALVTQTVDDAVASGRLDQVAYVGSSVGVLMLVGGQLGLARRYVETALALPWEGAAQDSVSTPQLAAVLSLWDDDPALASALHTWAPEGPELGPDPYDTAAWRHTAVLRSSGRPEAASETLLDHAEDARRRGWLSTAAILAIHARDICSTPRSRELAETCSGTVDSPLTALYFRAIAARDACDVEAMTSLRHDMLEHGAVVGAYRLTLAASRLAPPGASARALAAELGELRRLHPEAVFVAERTTTGPSLTAREREVVMAVLQGRSNAEVAREQFVSVRTVESHLHRAMKKLGVTRRSELRGLVDLL